MIPGDENSDPLHGDSVPGAIQQLLEHPLVNTQLTRSSEGAVEQAAAQGGANASHRGDPAFDTADFADSAPGNLRADYVLPRKSLQLHDGAVFWPLSTDPLFPSSGPSPSQAPTIASSGSTWQSQGETPTDGSGEAREANPACSLRSA